MKPLAATGLCCILAGCSNGQFPEGQNSNFAVQVTQMNASIDNATDSVDVALAVKNGSGVDIRSITMLLTPYDVAGKRTSAPGGEVTFSGPLKAGASAGPQTFSNVWQGSDVRCLEVRMIKVTLMDYSTSSVSGHGANNQVANDSRRECHASGDD
jgi:hypothetical protein